MRSAQIALFGRNIWEITRFSTIRGQGLTIAVDAFESNQNW